MKKALDQTLRDLKRGVNKNVLKVPGIEQKVLDATSNEPWGPHGSLLADIAQATRNYHEYQMIMVVIWKRINDTGKNWRHVYKALTVLDYLVANGSERVIDEIKEHAYQISTLSDFQYIDSGGRDQGSNVRKKSQSLVVLVNDKDRILEARQKASANRDKFRNPSTGGMYRPGSYGDRLDEDRFGYKDDDRNGYGRDDDRYGRGADSYSRDGDRYGRDSDDRYSRDGYRDDDYRGRSRSVDEYQYGSRSRSSDGYKDRAYDDDGRYSSRSSGGRAEEHSQDERRLERKFSEQNIAPPPPYEEAVTDARSPVHDERDGEIGEAHGPKESSPTGSVSQGSVTNVGGTVASPANQEFDGFDEFDPRGSFPAPPPTTSNGEIDLLGSLSESFSSNALALVPATSATTTSEADVPISSGPGPTFVALSSASTVLNQPVQDPFGDSPFKATPTTDNMSDQTQNVASTSNFQPNVMGQSSVPLQQAPPTVTSFDFGDTFSGITYAPPDVSNMQVPSTNSQFSVPDPSVSNQTTDVLADILPPTGSALALTSQPSFSAPSGSVQQHNAFHGNYLPQGGYTTPAASYGSFHSPSVQPLQQNTHAPGNFLSQMGHIVPLASHEAAPAPAPTVLSVNTQPPKKFETKSTVWTDTLNKGLVNLNISGPKINPLADIGVDFDSINRKEKRERPASATPVTSTITMGKAMGSGTGMGRAGANPLAPPPNPGMGPGMGMGMGGGAGMGMAGSSGVGMGMGGNSGMGMGMAGSSGVGMGMGGNSGMGMGMNMGSYGGMNQPMGVGMNMGMGQGGQMRPPTGLPPTPNMPGNYNIPGNYNMPGNYNPMMGPGGYPQQPYGGYR